MVATDTEVRLLKTTAHAAASSILADKQPTSEAGNKMESMDFYITSENETWLYWSDHSGKVQNVYAMQLVQSPSANPANLKSGKHRAHRETSPASKIRVLTDLQEPRGVAVDWVAQRLYVVDAGLDVIMVSTLQGNMTTIIVDSNLDQPHDILVDPQSG